jgi:hypothetical protein
MTLSAYPCSPIGYSRRDFLNDVGRAALLATLSPLAHPAKAWAHAASDTGAPVLRFAHLTDLHFTTRAQNRYPTSHQHIVRAVGTLNQESLDFVLFTGDMFHFPEDLDGDLPALTDALKQLNCPYYCLIGNHDAEGPQLKRRKLTLMENLGDQGLAHGRSFYSFSPRPGFRFIALDTTDTGEDSYTGWTGHVSDQQLNWLQDTLKAYREEKVFLALHHPPITPYPFLEKLRFEPKTASHLEYILRAHPQVQLAFAGHYHFGGWNSFAHAQLLIGPSLVEHPHPYRIVELFEASNAQTWARFSWHTLNLHPEDDERCVWSLAGLRGHGLQGLSYGRQGQVLLHGASEGRPVNV